MVERKEKVYSAVRGCLNRCFGAEDPLVQATDFLDRLRSDPSWNDREVAEVESLVLNAVQVIVRQKPEGCCHKSSARDLA